MESEGVEGIEGSCGFLALFQKEFSEVVSIPVFSSSLIQIPLAYQMTGGNAPVDVLTANSSALTAEHLASVGANNIPIEVVGLEDKEEFAAFILRNERNEMGLSLIEWEVMKASTQLQAKAPGILRHLQHNWVAEKVFYQQDPAIKW